LYDNAALPRDKKIYVFVDNTRLPTYPKLAADTSSWFALAISSREMYQSLPRHLTYIFKHKRC